MPEEKRETNECVKGGLIKKIKIIVNLKFLNIFLFFVLIFGVVYYLAGVNDLTVKGFRLNELENKFDSLNDENKSINLKITLLKSYNNLSERAKNLNMVAVGDVDYITITDHFVAKK